MAICISDFLEFDYFKSIEVLAGAEGLSRTVESCGILDYEMDQGVNKKYADQNFNPGQLVITSLLFAKNNPFLIRDAVKYVISKGCSGLVVKNVFRLPIHESVLRYADSKKFPILLMTDSQMYFETFIIQINKCIEMASSNETVDWELTRLLYQPLDGKEKKERVRCLFPTFRDQYRVIYCGNTDQPVSADVPEVLKKRLQVFDQKETSNRILQYQNGLFLVFSRNVITTEMAGAYAEIMDECCPNHYIGISNVHFQAMDIDTAMREAMYAAKVHRLRGKQVKNERFLFYDRLGVYRALLPLIEDESLQRYSSEILDPILEFDAENRGNLMDTLLSFVQCGGNLHVWSAQSSQHENTLRYRLDKIDALTGLDYRNLADYEQLALAARVYLLLNC